MRRGRAVAAALGLVVLAGCGGGEAAHPTPATAADAEAALSARLRDRDLSLRWVRCVDGGRRRSGAVVWRCNVNFGDPHIEAYCALLVDGTLSTQVEDPTLRCRRVRGAP